MEIVRANKYRLYPNAKQKQILHEYFGASRFVYNKILSEVKESHFGMKSKDGKAIPVIPGQTKLVNALTPLKSEHDFLYKRANDPLQASLSNLHKSFQNFFKGAGYPKFKSRKEKIQSFEMKANTRIRIEDNYINLPSPKKTTWTNDDLKIKFKKHKTNYDLPENVSSYTITKDNLNQYWISFIHKIEIKDRNKKSIKTVGIDLGIKDLIVTSDGFSTGNQKLTKKSQKKIRRLNKSLSRKKKFGKNWKKTTQKLAKAHKKIKNQRDYRNHSISRKLVDLYDFIGMESLRIKNMMKNRKLSKAIADASWYDLFIKMHYKMTEKQGQIGQIDTFFPSTKRCSSCGNVKKKMKLSERTYHCQECGLKIDRDVNAAINIENEAIRLFL